MINILPSKSKFIEDAKQGKIHPIYAEIPFIPPHEIYEYLESPYSFLFESANGPEKIARYSFIGVEPFLIFKVKDGIVDIEVRSLATASRLRRQESRPNESPEATGVKSRKSERTKTPLKNLREILIPYKIEQPVNIPPFIGGAVGLLSYDFVHYFERLPRTAIDDLNIPDAHFLFFDTVIAFDHKDKKTYIISCPGAREIIQYQSVKVSECQSGGKIRSQGFSPQSPIPNPQSCYDMACEKINSIYRRISSIRGEGDFQKIDSKHPVEIRHEMSKENYMNIVKKAKEYIRAGDIFQANLSQRVSADIGDVKPWQIYSTLREINPSPFAGYLNMGDYHIVSSSPERLLRVNGNIVETRPIAGTRPRGINAKGDIEMRAELLLNEKERAEHLMLIDLERNDLGRISDYGSVFVDEFMLTEDYSHVIHIVSNIRGTLAKDKDCFDAIKAAFPGGTITGVPKVRCMEIIDELEPTARGPYTGSFGYISFTGEMDLNIIIRTFVIKNNIAHVQAGAGIVADSDPEREYYETLKKAEALIRTLGKL
ncbi:MAG: anthranilate synthase component I family protein [Nitrospirae bacterium]|nr:anthranilate synthase component I family protein [Nitrospirota bacterium]